MSRYVIVLLVSFLASAFAVEELENQCSLVKSGRIVQGEDAPVGAFPFMASLRGIADNHFCGGSIIGDRWILTAAHCLQGINMGSVVVGSNVLNAGGDRYYPEKKIVHPRYGSSSITNDLGLVLLKSPIKFNKLVQPISLPTGDMDKHNYPAIATGWGRTFIGGPASNKLQFLRTCLMNKQSCSSKVPTTGIFQKICTFTKFGQGVCNGDSGSPLIVDGQQVGIASYVIYNCAQGQPDFFTRVATYLDWIKSEQSKY